jgi:hypothetical protein
MNVFFWRRFEPQSLGGRTGKHPAGAETAIIFALIDAHQCASKPPT